MSTVPWKGQTRPRPDSGGDLRNLESTNGFVQLYCEGALFGFCLKRVLAEFRVCTRGDRALLPGSSGGHEEEVVHFYQCQGEFGDHRIIEDPYSLLLPS